MRLLCGSALVQLGCNVKHVLRTTEKLLDPNKKNEMRKLFFFGSQSGKIKIQQE